KRSVEIWPAVAKQSPGGTSLGDCRKVEACRDHAFFVAPKLGCNVSGGAGNERGAVEFEFARLAVFDTDAVRSDYGEVIRCGVALHDAPPMIARIHWRGRWRFAADRRRIDQHVGAFKRHHAGGFGKPLIPADRTTQLPGARRPHAK